VHDCLYVVEPWKAGNVELFQGRSTLSLQIVIRVVDQAIKLWRVLGGEVWCLFKYRRCLEWPSLPPNWSPLVIWHLPCLWKGNFDGALSILVMGWCMFCDMRFYFQLAYCKEHSATRSNGADGEDDRCMAWLVICNDGAWSEEGLNGRRCSGNFCMYP